MKKLLSVVSVVAALTFGFASCSSESSDNNLALFMAMQKTNGSNSGQIVENGQNSAPGANSLLSKVAEGTEVDLSGYTFDEKTALVVSKKLTVKGANLNGGSITVDAPNVTLNGISNGSVMLSKNASSTKLVGLNNIKTLAVAGTENSRGTNQGTALLIENSKIVNFVNLRTNLSVLIKDTTKFVTVTIKVETALSAEDENTSFGKINASAPVVLMGKAKVEAIITSENPSVKIASSSVVIEKKPETVKVEQATNSDLEDFVSVGVDGEETSAPEVDFDSSFSIEKFEENIETLLESDISEIEEEFKKIDKEVEQEISKVEQDKEQAKDDQDKYEDAVEEEEKKENETQAATSDVLIDPSKINVPASDRKKTAKELTMEAETALAKQDYDTALAKYKYAYAVEQNDTTKINYTIMLVASLSSDFSVKSFIKDNLGVTNYPGSINALVTGSWLKDYYDTYKRGGLKVEKYNPDSSTDYYNKYFRVNGTPLTTEEVNKEFLAGSSSFRATPYKFHEDGKLLFSMDVIKDITLAVDGKYLLYGNDFPVDSKFRYKKVEIEDVSKATVYFHHNTGLFDIVDDDDTDYRLYLRVNADVDDSRDSENAVYVFEASFNEDENRYILYDNYKYLKNITPAVDGEYVIRLWSYKGPRYEFIQDPIGDYYRITGTETTSGQRYGGYTANGYDDSWYLKDVDFSETGNYYVDHWYIDGVIADKYKDYVYTIGSFDSLIEILSEKNPDKAPEFAVPEWITNTDAYNNTLFEGVQTSASISYLIWSNIISLNQNGANEALDKLIPIFSKRFEAAKKLVDSIGDGYSTLSASTVNALNLTEFLGDDDVDISKTEMNIVVSGLELINAALKYAASYDLSANMKAAQVDSTKLSEAEVVSTINKCITDKTLTVRNADYLKESKALMLDAVSTLISTYDVIKDSKLYPQAAKEQIARYGSTIYSGLNALKSALTNGTTFYIPETYTVEDFQNLGSAWPTSENGSIFVIDMGKAFTAGYLTDLIERDSSNVTPQYYYQEVVTFNTAPVQNNNQTEWYAFKDGKMELIDLDNNFQLIFGKDTGEYTKITRDLSSAISELKEKAGSYMYDYKYNNSYKYTLPTMHRYVVYMKVNTGLLLDALPGMEGDREYYWPIITVSNEKVVNKTETRDFESFYIIGDMNSWGESKTTKVGDTHEFRFMANSSDVSFVITPSKYECYSDIKYRSSTDNDQLLATNGTVSEVFVENGNGNLKYTGLKEGKFYKIKFGVENCDYESFLECIIKHCAPKLNITLEEDGF